VDVAKPSPSTSSDPADAWLGFATSAVEHAAARHREARSAGAAESAGATDHGKQSRALAGELERARAAFADSLNQETPFASIVGNARLRMADSELLAIALGCELDMRLARLVAFIQDDPSRVRLTLQTADAMLRDSGSGVASVLGNDSALRRAALVEVVDDGPWAQHFVVVHPGVIWALVGDTGIDEAIPIGATVVDDPSGSDATNGFVVVTGEDRVRRRDEAIRRTGASRFIVSSAPTDQAGWDALVREATLSGTGIVIELDGQLSADGRRTITRADHVPWALTTRRELALGDMPDRPWLEFAAPSLDPDDAEWVERVGPIDRRGHHLSAEQLDQVARALPASHGDLDAAVRRLVAGPLEQLAQRIHPTRGWDDIVLSSDRIEHLRGIVDRYRFASTVYDDWGFSAHPSRGLVALFSGPSGTGKTLAAEIIAGELGLDVFKLNLSAVVSKYIGETEKNLEQIFDAAGSGNVVLFFDEADSLFGKRSEVKDARDRYANLEVSYLLQRLERYDGVVLLATNFEKNVDEAFLRRIHARIEFPVPGAPERRLIWIRNFPKTAPIEGIDVDFLAAQFEMSGGSIRNAAVHAAFLAAAAGSAIEMDHAVTGVAREYRKLGRLLKPEHFGRYFDMVTRVE
jgi:ATPase family associated with various cellular activities (AAA)